MLALVFALLVEQVVTITLSQVQQHTIITDCWTAVDGIVYDVSKPNFVHPNGDADLLNSCGIDATTLWHSKHGVKAAGIKENTAPRLRIGTLTTAPTVPPSSPSSLPKYSRDDVKSHSTAADCWTTIRDRVYALTAFISTHPGGVPAISRACGADATADFTRIHPPRVPASVLPIYLIGDLSDPEYTLEQVEMHSSEQSCWTIIDGTVHDVTAFVGSHPGGKPNILSACGIDATSRFNSVGHPATVKSTVVPTYAIGVLAATPSYSRADVALHTNEQSCWTIIRGNVYDVTAFIPSHPGGRDNILSACGVDPTTKWYEIHKQSTKSGELPKHIIGTLLEGSATPSQGTLPAPQYTIEDVAGHGQQSDCWTIIGGKVYNMTSFFGTHPGGDDNLRSACGIDATVTWESIHQPTTREIVLPGFLIGEQQGQTTPTPSAALNVSGNVTFADVQQHNTQSSCWTVILNAVYDVTAFISTHPGGVANILTSCGADATATFSRIHQDTTKMNTLPQFKIADLSGATVATNVVTANDAGHDKRNVKLIVAVAIAFLVICLGSLLLFGCAHCNKDKKAKSKTMHGDGTSMKPLPDSPLFLTHPAVPHPPDTHQMQHDAKEQPDGGVFPPHPHVEAHQPPPATMDPNIHPEAGNDDIYGSTTAYEGNAGYGYGGGYSGDYGAGGAFNNHYDPSYEHNSAGPPHNYGDMGSGFEHDQQHYGAQYGGVYDQYAYDEQNQQHPSDAYHYTSPHHHIPPPYSGDPRLQSGGYDKEYASVYAQNYHENIAPDSQQHYTPESHQHYTPPPAASGGIYGY